LDQEGLFSFFERAFEFVSTNYPQELICVDERHFENIDANYFLNEYVYVILNSGMKNQVAEKIFRNFCRFGLNAVRHDGKREAIPPQPFLFSVEVSFFVLGICACSGGRLHVACLGRHTALKFPPSL
jgi:hypothetical protein